MREGQLLNLLVFGGFLFFYASAKICHSLCINYRKHCTVLLHLFLHHHDCCKLVLEVLDVHRLYSIVLINLILMLKFENLNCSSIYLPDDRRSTWSLSNTQREARESQSVGVRKQTVGVLCSSLSCVKLRIFSATAPFVTFSHASDSLPLKMDEIINNYVSTTNKLRKTNRAYNGTFTL